MAAARTAFSSQRLVLAARGLPLLVRTGSMRQVVQTLRREFSFTHLFSHEETGSGWSTTRQTREANAEAEAIQHKHGSRKSGLPPSATRARRSLAAPDGQGQLFQSGIECSTLSRST